MIIAENELSAKVPYKIKMTGLFKKNSLLENNKSQAMGESKGASKFLQNLLIIM